MNDGDGMVVEAMQRMGGAFVRALASAAVYADPENLERIKRTWPEYWARYELLAAVRGQPPEDDDRTDIARSLLDGRLSFLRVIGRAILCTATGEGVAVAPGVLEHAKRIAALLDRGNAESLIVEADRRGIEVSWDDLAGVALALRGDK